LSICYIIFSGAKIHAQTFPVIAGVNYSAKTVTTGTAHTINLPTGIQSGDLIIIFWVDATTTGSVSTPSGFTQLYSSTVGSRIRRAWYKIATGSETDTVIVTGAEERSAHTSYRILAGTFQGIPVAGSVVAGIDNSPNPPNLAPSWGSYKTLWIAASHSEGDIGGAVPNGYGDYALGYTNSTGSAHVRMMTAHRLLEAASENPVEFSLNQNRNWAANVVAVQGANITPPFKPVLRLMPLGDSITNGFDGSSNGIGRAGYRKPLIDLLENLGYETSIVSARDINFIGSDITGFGDFDQDNEGHGGHHASNTSNTAISIFHHLSDYLNDNPPDIVLLHIGTNDISTSDTPANIVSEVSSLLDIIYTSNPQITVILAKIINRLSTPTQITTTNSYNSALQTMAEQRITNGDNLYLVDAGDGFIYTQDVDPPFTSDMYDNVHPNDSGYVKIARVWFDKLKEILTPALVSPADESIDQPTNVTFSWNAALGAGTYHLQVATSSDFSSGIVYDNSALTDTSVEVALTENANYYWRVRAKINTGSSPYSETRTLTTALPVELSAFTIKLKNKTAELFWRTETEVSNFGFEVERASSRQVGTTPLQWNKIGFVEGHGNSNSPKEYLYIDKNLFGGTKFIYRLKQIDTDGAFAYSGEVEITLLPEKFELVQNYPNPFNPSTTISFAIPEDANVILKVYDILGQEVKTLIDEPKEAGIHKVEFDASGLVNGFYIYSINAGDFTQVKKMLLIK
jgi:lysophospholipase L1-like esterase